MARRFFSSNWDPAFGPGFAMAGGPGARWGKPGPGGPGPRWAEAEGDPGPGPRGGRHAGRRWRHHEAERFGGPRHMRGGGFGGGGAGDVFFGPARRRGRGRRRRGDVRMALLMLLGEEPRNGYQLMQVIEERSDGRWRPSPGSVYPVLSQLEDEGLVRATEREGSRLFELTDAGRERLAEAKDVTPPWEADDDGLSGRRDMRRLVGEVAAAAMQVNHLGDDQQIEQAIETMKNTRRTLYRILAEEEDV